MPCPWRGMMRFRHPGEAPDNVPDSQKSPGMFPAMFPIQFPISVTGSLGRPDSRPDPMELLGPWQGRQPGCRVRVGVIGCDRCESGRQPGVVVDACATIKVSDDLGGRHLPVDAWSLPSKMRSRRTILMGRCC